MADIPKSPTLPGHPLCFVIGPIGKDASPERRHSDLLLNAVIKHVLEQVEFGYKVKRADEDADPGMIGDRVVTDIINARLVVADLTDLNANAFYELGIRHSTEKPTIHVARTGTALPFDNIAHRTIFVDLTDWHSIEQARNRLAESARAISGPDYRVSNPITQANASFKMRQSEDPRDRLFAEIQERLAALERPTEKTESPSSQLETVRRVRRQAVVSLLGIEATQMLKEHKTPDAIERELLPKAKAADNEIAMLSCDGGYLEVVYADGVLFRTSVV
jgi:hypothetical protein